ncbi:hypothetical protein Slin14017_G033290 [Septoria linicola]|nr:hypothetical protein Slin14017_G033290 [Septoria linicola]
MSGHPSRRPVSPVGGGYYDVREVRPDNYERERDADNLNRYGTIRRTNGPPVGHPSERAYPEFRRIRRHEDDYGAAGVDVSSYGGGFPPSSCGGGQGPMPTYNSASRYPEPPFVSAGPQPRRSSSRRTHRSSSRPREPVADIGSLAGDFRPFNTPSDGFDRRPPPRDYSQVDELDLYDSGARRQRYASPPRRSTRPPAGGSALPTPQEFAASTSRRGPPFPVDYYGGPQQPSGSYYSERRRPW